MDQPVIQRPQRRSIDSEPLGDAGSETFDGDIRGSGQRVDDLASLFSLQIDCDATLVSVGAQKNSSKTGRRKRRLTARFIALPDGFHLDDVGAEIAEILGAQGPGQDFRQIQDAYSSQGFRHG